ncbi:MAG: hypothetical protein ABI726_09960 [bacterium]
MAFFDEDDALPPDDQGPSRSHGGARQRPYIARRLLFLAISVGVIILVVIGVRGCLDARKERNYDNYVRDLVSITTESQALSQEFFGRLKDPGDLSELDFKAEISNDRSTAESLLERVRGLGTPDDLAEAQSELELAFKLRRDGIAGTADQISTALGNDPKKAIDRIATYMRYFLASDVLYRRSRDGITVAFADAAITQKETLPDTDFLPEPIEDWLDPTTLGATLAGVAGSSGDVAPGIHGLELIETQINGTTLSPDVATTISGGVPYELEVSAQNQGDNSETDVPVSFTLSGGAKTVEGDGTIPKITAGVTKSAKLEIQPDPSPGDELTLEVTVGPVPGEELTDNNTSTYTVVFE